MKRNIKKKNVYNNIIIIFTIIIIAISLVLSICLFISSVDESENKNNYYGPLLPDAEYEERMRFQIMNSDGEKIVTVNSNWMGIVIEAHYSIVCNCSIDIISPSGIKITTFDFSLTQEEIDNGDENVSSGQLITLEPGAWPGEIYGNWVFDYSINGGPALIIITQVISCGNPS